MRVIDFEALMLCAVRLEGVCPGDLSEPAQGVSVPRGPRALCL